VALYKVVGDVSRAGGETAGGAAAAGYAANGGETAAIGGGANARG